MHTASKTYIHTGSTSPQYYAFTHGTTQKELMQNRTEPTHRVQREVLFYNQLSISTKFLHWWEIPNRQTLEY